MKWGRDDPAAITHLKMNIAFPTPRKPVMLSTPQRLVGIMVQRGLLGGNEIHLQIRPEALHKPVFLRAGPRGLGLTEFPTSSKSLTGCQELRAKRIGFGDRCTFCAWAAEGRNQREPRGWHCADTSIYGPRF